VLTLAVNGSVTVTSGDDAPTSASTCTSMVTVPCAPQKNTTRHRQRSVAPPSMRSFPGPLPNGISGIPPQAPAWPESDPPCYVWRAAPPLCWVQLAVAPPLLLRGHLQTRCGGRARGQGGRNKPAHEQGNHQPPQGLRAGPCPHPRLHLVGGGMGWPSKPPIGTGGRLGRTKGIGGIMPTGMGGRTVESNGGPIPMAPTGGSA
jgi:hypothetical protein